MPPSAERQVEFLANIQRLLDEGLFVASYKFALLLSLADIAVEEGDDSGCGLSLSTRKIGEKFVLYYWRQAIPYPGTTTSEVLRQNTGPQAAILNLINVFRQQHGQFLTSSIKATPAWNRLVTKVARVVETMPLWKLQTVAGSRLDFLYENSDSGNTVELREGVAYCFRKFHSLIGDLVRGAWTRYVRSQNAAILGEVTDLGDFLFGSERISLAAVRPVLLDIQNGRCFYCGGPLHPATTHVDHFIAWARYPVDLAHNFVLADNRCNSQKRELLPASEHLSSWADRNHQHGSQIASELENRGIIAELGTSNRIARWVYSQTEAMNGFTWLRGETLVPLSPDWRNLI